MARPCPPSCSSSSLLQGISAPSSSILLEQVELRCWVPWKRDGGQPHLQTSPLTIHLSSALTPCLRHLRSIDHASSKQ